MVKVLSWLTDFLISGDAIISILCQQIPKAAFLLCSWLDIGWMLPRRCVVYSGYCDALSILLLISFDRFCV